MPQKQLIDRPYSDPLNPSNMDSILYGGVPINPPKAETVAKLAKVLRLGAGVAVVGLLAASVLPKDDSDNITKAPITNDGNNQIIENDTPLELPAPQETIISVDSTPNRDQLSNDQRKRITDKLNEEPNVLENIATLKPIYEDVQKQSGVDWKILAALQYRESTASLDRSAVSGELLGTPNYDSNVIYGTKWFDNVSMTAKIFAENAKYFYGIDVTKPMTDEQIKKALLAYNRGHIYKDQNVGPDKSPYVMNYYVEELMLWPNDPKLENESTKGKQDTQIGAFLLFKYLEEQTIEN